MRIQHDAGKISSLYISCMREFKPLQTTIGCWYLSFRDGSGTNWEISKDVGLAICEAFEQADKGKFDNAVEILKPARYKVVTIGGSNAQRDVFNLFLIHAALNSPKKQHHQLARSLLTERKAKKNSAPMTDRLMAQALALHAE